MSRSAPALPSAPPSIGGAAMAGVSGLWLGSNLATLGSGGAPLPLTAWLAPLGLLLAVVVLLGIMQRVRDRMGVPMPPAARQRQRRVVAAVLLVGLVAGLGVGLSAP